MAILDRKKRKQVEAYQQELIKTHYVEVENMYKKMRGWRHDYIAHIQTLKVLLSGEKYEEIAEYLEKLDTDLQTVDTVVKTGNAMADAILNSKISLAKAKEIEVVAKANIPFKLKISEIDLCVIIGNLFDNAIEASLKLPKEQRQIRVYLDMKGTQVYISLTNFTAYKKQLKFGNIYKTTKGLNHGLGLSRIDDTVKKLGGYISRNSEDGVFTTEILV